MPTVPLPNDPSLEKLRIQARRLQRSVRARDAAALELVGELHPSGAPAEPADFPLSAAQLVTARRYGFQSWPALKHHLDLVARYSWNPDQPDDAADEAPADRLCRLACLWYQDDGPARWAQARALLARNPALSGAHIWAAAAANDAAATARLLAADPALAVRRGGPFGWCPLFYLAYSRLDPAVPAGPVLAIARLLLAAGADPNEGYLWHGLPTPFTLLTGAFGHGELGPENQPAHPQAAALARLLLDAGADPNDGQALYNRMFEPDNDHLELLLEYGLGAGDGGPWKARLRGELGAPGEMLRGELDWAVAHDQLARVRLLVEHGVDVTTRDGDGHTPVEVAALCGNAEIVEYLLSAGAAPLTFDELDTLIAAVMAGDRRRTLAAPAALRDQLRAERPWLLVWAAARGRAQAVALFLELGVDPDIFGRGDIPSEQAWQTALHTAAGNGSVAVLRVLLDAGADPNLRDSRFGGTALGWAIHNHQDAAAALLEPLTDPNPEGDEHE